MKNKTHLVVAEYNRETGKKSFRTETIHFKDIRGFEDLPEPCQSEEVRQDYEAWRRKHKG